MGPLIPIAMQLAQFVPGIIKLLGGDKAGEAAEKVVDIAQIVTGTSDGPAALAAIKADPAKVIEFQQSMEDKKNDLEKAYLTDVQNARHMQEIALGQDDLFSKRFVYYFAAAWSLFSMIYFFAVTFATIPDGGQRIADTILGVLIASVVGVMFAYFYGSTKNSAETRRLLAQSSPPK